MLSKKEINMVRRDIDTEEEKLAFIFSALSDMGRYRIFKLLLRQKDLCVTDIANVLDVSVPAASQQLRIMEMSGLLKKERRGQTTCYSVRVGDPVVKSVIRIVNKFYAI